MMFGSLLQWTSHHLYYYSGILARLAAKHHLNNIAPISDFSADICSVDYVGRDLGGRCPFMSFAPCFGCCVLLLCLLLLCNVMICYVMLCICSMSTTTTSSCPSCSEGGVIPFLWLLCFCMFNLLAALWLCWLLLLEQAGSQVSSDRLGIGSERFRTMFGRKHILFFVRAHVL